VGSLKFITPEWDAPEQVRAVTTTRSGGVSEGGYDSLNLGDRAGDNEEAVAENRRRLRTTLQLPSEPAWLWQVHGDAVVNAETATRTPKADASVTHSAGAVCVVLTADCLPVLFCDDAGSVVAAAHAGWRGLAAGILPATVAKMGVDPANIQAWLGPAIGPEVFEVGLEVRAEFVHKNRAHAAAFIPGEPQKYLANIYQLARRELADCGVTRVTGGDHCTVSEPEHFYSYRRDKTSGRMASFIWLKN